MTTLQLGIYLFITANQLILLSTKYFFFHYKPVDLNFPLFEFYEGKNGELVDKDESAYTSNPTPSQCYVESTSLHKDGILSDYLERTTNTIAGVNAWEDSYDDFREDFRGLGKDMSILPGIHNSSTLTSIILISTLPVPRLTTHYKAAMSNKGKSPIPEQKTSSTDLLLPNHCETTSNF